MRPALLIGFAFVAGIIATSPWLERYKPVSATNQGIGVIVWDRWLRRTCLAAYMDELTCNEANQKEMTPIQGALLPIGRLSAACRSELGESTLDATAIRLIDSRIQQARDEGFSDKEIIGACKEKAGTGPAFGGS